MIFDGGTNCSALGRSARILSFSGRYADMYAFTDGLKKENVPICDGAYKVYQDGKPYLLGVREAPYLEHNQHGLVSTGQAREYGTWIDDCLLRHGGEQRVIQEAVCYDDNESIGLKKLDLEAHDGLLSLETHYPTDEDMRTCLFCG